MSTFSVKVDEQKGKGLDLGTEPPRTKFCRVPPPPSPHPNPLYYHCFLLMHGISLAKENKLEVFGEKNNKDI